MGDLFSNETLEAIENLKKKRQDTGIKIGFVASSLDCTHCGHVIMLADGRKQCDYLVVCLQTDPTLDRDTKNKPIQDWEERRIMVESIRYVDEIIKYATEADLHKILTLLKPDVRILGSDWMNKPYTGHEISDIPIYWHRRDHDYSTTNLRDRIYRAEQEKRQLKASQ